MVGGLMKMDN